MNVPKIRTDPRIRQNLNHLQNTFESATDSARAGCFAFTKTYLEPLYDSFSSCYTSCCTTCCSYIPDSDSHSHHHNQQRNNNSEFPFDFYNDDYWYDYDDGGRGPSGGFLAWGNDELDRLLAGSSSGGSGGHRASQGMYYGSHNNTSHHHSDIRSGALGLIGGRRKRHTGAGGGSGLQHADGRGASDPTVIPSTSAFGFLGRFPWWGRVERRYRPSAADLQEHPGMPRDFPHHSNHDDEEAQGLLYAGPSDHNNNSRAYTQYRSSSFPNNRGRKRSHTSSSGTSGESFRSRGDLFPSDGEDDAVPLGDEFSIVLRSGGSGASDIDGEMSMRGLRRGSVLSGMSSAPPSSRRRSTTGGDVGYQGDDSGGEGEDDDDGQRIPRGRKGPEITAGELDEEALKTQEAALAEAEEREIERKRAQAKRLALERGLTQRSPTMQPRSRSSPRTHSTHVSYAHTPTIGMGMLSPMSLPTNSPRMLPYSTPIPHPAPPRMYPSSNPRSPGGMRSPVLAGARSPAQTLHMPNHVAAAAAALRRPMSPISPLGESPVRGSPLEGGKCISERREEMEGMDRGGEVERVMSSEEISRSASEGGGGIDGLWFESNTDVQRQVLARREVVEPFVVPPPLPSVDRIPEKREDEVEEEEGHGYEGGMVVGGHRQTDGVDERRRQHLLSRRDEEVASGILPHMRPSA